MEAEAETVPQAGGDQQTSMRIILILFLSLGAAFAETRQERGKRIVNEALEALGGKAFLAMQNRVESGRVYSFYRAELSGLSKAVIYTHYLSKTGATGSEALLTRERQSFGKEEDRGAVLFTEDKGYEITFRGARPLPADTLERYKLSTLHNVFYILRQRLDEPGLILESEGSEVFENQPIEVVNITDVENRTVTVSFHRSTKLPVRQVFYRRDPKTRARIEEVSVFSKYRDVGGGVQWPYTIQRERDGDKIFEIYSEEVAINQKLSDDLFQLTPKIKVLKPAR
jgi:hypothetical protein